MPNLGDHYKIIFKTVVYSVDNTFLERHKKMRYKMTLFLTTCTYLRRL